MEVIWTDTGETWRHQFSCERCGTVAVADPGDLAGDDFKVSGSHFDGSARCEFRLLVVCPTCQKLSFVDGEDGAAVPYLLRQRAAANRGLRSRAG